MNTLPCKQEPPPGRIYKLKWFCWVETEESKLLTQNIDD